MVGFPEGGGDGGQGVLRVCGVVSVWGWLGVVVWSASVWVCCSVGGVGCVCVMLC